VRFLSIPLAALIALFGLPLLARWVLGIWSGLVGPPQDALQLALGVGLGARLVHTTIHEACHALVALLLLVPVRSFQVSDGQGGAVLHDRVDWLRTTIIAIAPYTLPLLLVPAMIAQEFAAPSWRPAATFAVGLLGVHHLHALWHNVRLNFLGRQSDLARCGRLLSLVLIAGGLLGLAGWLMRVLWR
jgi:hypothetical protein